MQTDEDTDLINKETQSLFHKHRVNWFTSENLIKAQMVEIFDGILKERIYKHFSAPDTKRWVDVLKDVVQNYNTYNRTIEMVFSVETEQDPYGMTEKTTNSKDSTETKFESGDYVRISNHQETFKGE